MDGEQLKIFSELALSSGEAVQNNSFSRFRLFHFFGDDLGDYLVADQTSRLDNASDRLNEILVKTAGNSALENLSDFIPSRYMVVSHILAQQLGIGPLAYTGSPEEEEEFLFGGSGGEGLQQFGCQSEHNPIYLSNNYQKIHSSYMFLCEKGLAQGNKNILQISLKPDNDNGDYIDIQIASIPINTRRMDFQLYFFISSVYRPSLIKQNISKSLTRVRVFILPPVFTVFTRTVRPATYSAIEAVAILLLTVGLVASTALTLRRTFHTHIFAKLLQPFSVKLGVRTIETLAFLATVELVAKALTVEFQTLRFLAIALQSALEFWWSGGRRLNGNERVVLEHVLKSIIPCQLDRVQLAQLYLAALPFSEETGKNIFPLFGFVLEQDKAAILANFVGDFFGVGRDREFADLHLMDMVTASNKARKVYTTSSAFFIDNSQLTLFHQISQTDNPLPPRCSPNYLSSLLTDENNVQNRTDLQYCSGINNQISYVACLMIECQYFDIIMGNNPENREHIAEQNQLLVGFENKPLTLCYANCILQVLFHHPVFSSLVERSNYSKGVLFHLNELLSNMRKRKKLQSVSTSKLMKFVEAESAIFQRERHQDCHEFYIWLMNSINDQIKGKNKQMVTPLEEQFYYKQVTRTQCQVCQTVTEREEDEVDMSFSLPEPNVSLNYCISNYSKAERFTGKNMFKCDHCGKLVEALKWSLIKTLPNFLSIQLRRFNYDEMRKGLVKLNWQVPFPFKLKVSTNYDKQQKEGVYKLVGVVVHLGTGENYGHYLSYIKIGAKWYIFNDDEISETQDYMLESLWGYKGLTKCAYMLFYSI